MDAFMLATAFDKEAVRIMQTPFVMSMFAPIEDEGDIREKVEFQRKDGDLLEDVLHQMSIGNLSQGQIFDETYWINLVNGQLAVGAIATRQPVTRVPQEEIDRLRESLSERGFMSSEPVNNVLDVELDKIVQAIAALKHAGWPPVFAYVFDSLWEIFYRVWDVYSEVLGGECVLEPSCHVYALSAQSQAGRYVGGNFGLPHRDHPFAESFDEEGKATILSVWIPLNDVTLDNGCMHVLPKEFDVHFDQDEHPYHLRCATRDKKDESVVKVRFDLAGARPLPAGRGSALGWTGNLIHWGARCHKGVPPRVSMTGTFRRRQAEKTHLQGDFQSISREQVLTLTLKQRLQVIAKSLLLYKWWYPLPDSSVPSIFFDAL
eukprot:GILK01009335.1.p1 GENE.GILK01009335.1~~GILK01009335.1.p1  ORF type:complete len:375 (-),score=37.99 GILK01009335.1:41-1165(-)